MNHDFYIWMSYGMTALAIAVEIAWLRIARSRALRGIEGERQLEAQD
jgi:heme exporter protein CcmD